jgi:type IV pilus assembly protein PilV
MPIALRAVRATPASRQAGFSLIEVLVTLVILLLGLLGLVGMMLQSQRAEMESYQRAQALVLLQDMVGRIRANPTAAPCYAITDATAGTPYMGVGSSALPACALGTLEAYTLANSDLAAWDSLLKGTAEGSSGANVGAMVGARGCVNFDVVTKVYLVSVAWQGVGKTAAPNAVLSCGTGLYGDETQRRVVSLPLQIANLN